MKCNVIKCNQRIFSAHGCLSYFSQIRKIILFSVCFYNLLFKSVQKTCRDLGNCITTCFGEYQARFFSLTSKQIYIKR